ncbi:hypothetical protein FHS78_003805 [Parvibaculum indicum]|uniref:hypothetical protein n=1 Tax=Parvibaculum indicum TaxID=562969 RepID=UPI00141DE5A7|nr:hypothetical protein [Parvibaculum indicum]NIJ43490.1 hypothetical protein [Parvibaculum indicum]
MSLTQVIQRQEVRDAFRANAIKERTPKAIRSCPLLVPPTTKLYGIVGHAFDYLARIHLRRKLEGSAVTVLDYGWFAEHEKHRLEWHCVRKQDYKFWVASLSRAKTAAQRYQEGDDNLLQMSQYCQLLANVEILARSGRFDPDFRPHVDISNELIQMIEILDRQEEFCPETLCVLNPRFEAASLVGGADADLVLDDRLIDFKTASRPIVRLEYQLQLAAYTALQRKAGLEGVPPEQQPEFRKVELYFARFGILLSWSLEELFPDGGFDRFCTAFDAELGDEDGGVLFE